MAINMMRPRSEEAFGPLGLLGLASVVVGIVVVLAVCVVVVVVAAVVVGSGVGVGGGGVGVGVRESSPVKAAARIATIVYVLSLPSSALQTTLTRLFTSVFKSELPLIVMVALPSSATAVTSILLTSYGR